MMDTFLFVFETDYDSGNFKFVCFTQDIEWIWKKKKKQKNFAMHKKKLFGFWRIIVIWDTLFMLFYLLDGHI